MKKLIIFVLVITAIAAGYWFYTKGKQTTGNPALDAEDARFFRIMWDEFTRLTGDSPNWVLDNAISLYKKGGARLTEFERHNGQPLKSGALLVIIAQDYQPWAFSKLDAAKWTTLYALYQNWKANLNLNF